MRSESYKRLRKSVEGLGKLKGQRSTNQIIEALDPVWRSLLKVRVEILNTLKERGVDVSKVRNDDFLSLYLQIHNGNSNSRLCNNCFGSVSDTLSICPYCGGDICGLSNNVDRSVATIDFDQTDYSPNWGIDYSAGEILDKEKLIEENQNTPVLTPITKRDDIPGPTGVTQEPRKRSYEKMASSTKDMIKWNRKREFINLMPFTIQYLANLAKSSVKKRYANQDLRLIITLFPSGRGIEYSQLLTIKNDELISKILGWQENETPDAGPMPHGSLPEVN